MESKGIHGCLWDAAFALACSSGRLVTGWRLDVGFPRHAERRARAVCLSGRVTCPPSVNTKATLVMWASNGGREAMGVSDDR